MTIAQLRLRWVRLWDEIGATGDPLYWFDRIIAQWSLSDRFYHGIDHLVEGLQELDAIRNLFNKPLAAEMAWWLHDVVYDARKPLGESEQMSADFAEYMLHQAEVPLDIILEVVAFILASKHDTKLLEFDLQLFADLDIIRMGSPEDQWKENSGNIRKEYEWVPQKKYEENRALVLRRFFDRKKIFYTDYYNERLGAQAKKNLESALRELNAL